MTDGYNVACLVTVTRRKMTTLVEITGPRLHHHHTLWGPVPDHECEALVIGSGWVLAGRRIQRGDGWQQEIRSVI